MKLASTGDHPDYAHQVAEEMRLIRLAQETFNAAFESRNIEEVVLLILNGQPHMSNASAAAVDRCHALHWREPLQGVLKGNAGLQLRYMVEKALESIKSEMAYKESVAFRVSLRNNGGAKPSTLPKIPR